MCDRTVCNKEPKFRIFNDSTVEGRKYCPSCFFGIIKHNPELEWKHLNPDYNLYIKTFGGKYFCPNGKQVEISLADYDVIDIIEKKSGPVYDIILLALAGF